MTAPVVIVAVASVALAVVITIAIVVRRGRRNPLMGGTTNPALFEPIRPMAAPVTRQPRAARATRRVTAASRPTGSLFDAADNAGATEVVCLVTGTAVGKCACPEHS